MFVNEGDVFTLGSMFVNEGDVFTLGSLPCLSMREMCLPWGLCHVCQ